MDPRIFQLCTLAGLLLYGMVWLDFEIGAVQAAMTLAAVLLTQWVCTRLARLPNFEWKSALISGLSLGLLCRSNQLWLVALCAIVTIASKFTLRWRGKHIFNPTNFGLVAIIALSDDRVWVSPGQWGNVAFFGFLMACLGGLVVNRAARSDVTLAFLGFYLGLVISRSLYLGEPLAIPLHRLQSGALLLFAFFMVSDPKTTPDTRIGRILFAALVAAGAWYITFRLFRTNGLLWSLAGFSIAVPLIDWLLPGTRYRWRSASAPAGPFAGPQPVLQ